MDAKAHLEALTAEFNAWATQTKANLTGDRRDRFDAYQAEYDAKSKDLNAKLADFKDDASDAARKVGEGLSAAFEELKRGFANAKGEFK